MRPTPLHQSCFLHFGGLGSVYLRIHCILCLSVEIIAIFEKLYLFLIYFTGNENLSVGASKEDY